MSSPLRVFLDTNVALYTIGNDNPFRDACLRLLTAVAAGRLRGASDTEVIQEIVYQASGRGRRALGIDLAERFMAAVDDLLPVAAEDMVLALALMREHEHLSPRDAVHLAVMRRHGLTHIVTADRHFADVPGLTVLSPHAAAAMLGS